MTAVVFVAEQDAIARMAEAVGQLTSSLLASELWLTLDLADVTRIEPDPASSGPQSDWDRLF